MRQGSHCAAEFCQEISTSEGEKWIDHIVVVSSLRALMTDPLQMLTKREQQQCMQSYKLRIVRYGSVRIECFLHGAIFKYFVELKF